MGNKAQRKEKKKLEQRIMLFEKVKNSNGFTKPGSMNRKKN